MANTFFAVPEEQAAKLAALYKRQLPSLILVQPVRFAGQLTSDTSVCGSAAATLMPAYAVLDGVAHREPWHGKAKTVRFVTSDVGGSGIMEDLSRNVLARHAMLPVARVFSSVYTKTVAGLKWTSHPCMRCQPLFFYTVGRHRRTGSVQG